MNMSTTTDMVGESVCVVFSYNTRFSRLCHAAPMPLCANLLSAHAHVVPFARALKEVVPQSDFTWRERELHVCACGILLLEQYLQRDTEITDTTTGLLF